MKKIKLIFTVLICLGFFPTFSQNMYAQFSIGYGMPSGTQSIGEDITTDYSNGDYKTKSLNGSYGAGLNFNCAFGFMFSPNIGLDINVNYLLGNSATTYKYFEIYDTGNGIYTDNRSEKTSSSGLFLSPTLVISVGGIKFSPYAKLGVALGSLTQESEYEMVSKNDNTITNSEFEERDITGEFSFGIRGGFGVTYSLTNNFLLYTECMYTGMNYLKKESVVTKYIYDGQDELDDLREYYRRTIYVKETNQNNEDTSIPREEVQKPTPLSSITINVGVRFAFGGI